MSGELLYPYSLVPVLSVSVLLFFTSLRQGRAAVGLTMYCFTLAIWSGMLAALWVESLADFAERFAAAGSFIAASYLHAAYEVTDQKRYGLVYLAYTVAAVLTLGGILWPGLQYGPRAMVPGPLFWPSMGLAMVAAVVPLWHLYRSYQVAEVHRRPVLNRLAIGGVLAYTGGLGNALLLAHAHPVPYPMFLVLGGLFMLAHVVRSHEAPAERRLMERSMAYSALAAALSAGFLFGVMTLMDEAGAPLRQYRFSALFLLVMAAVAFEPVRQQLQERIGRRVAPDRVSATDVSVELDKERARADQVQRLAEIGQLTSAVAHEVRNPLGVLSAHLSLLARQDVDPDTIDAMKTQIERASTFVEDLLRYGRPRPLELRIVDAGAMAELALSTARQGAGFDTTAIQSEVVVEPDASLLIEADQAQLQQVLVVLIDNGLLALDGRPEARLEVRLIDASDRIAISVEDNGPGIPEAIQDRLFEPFVTSRKREGPRLGTGLGLAIARGIVERHHGKMMAGRSERLGGARFDIELLKVQPVLLATEQTTKETSP